MSSAATSSKPTLALRRGLSNMTLAAKTRLRMALGRKPRFTGAFASRQEALDALPTDNRKAYDQDDVVSVSLQSMQQLAPWDYPVIYWLTRALQDKPTASLLDAGGHLGTKFTAFSGYLPIERISWHIWDLPAILRAGQAGQARGEIPAALHFQPSPAAAGPVDILLASGLMQYIDRPLSQLLAEMAAPPEWIILNKVALRDGDTIVTHEQIGPARVPYQIRNQHSWQSELNILPYELLDSWENPMLSHLIGTHPGLGQSRSVGHVLRRIPA